VQGYLPSDRLVERLSRITDDGVLEGATTWEIDEFIDRRLVPLTSAARPSVMGAR
jgi:hypothetical protein